jgi:hypothetical protein
MKAGWLVLQNLHVLRTDFPVGYLRAMEAEAPEANENSSSLPGWTLTSAGVSISLCRASSLTRVSDHVTRPHTFIFLHICDLFRAFVLTHLPLLHWHAPRSARCAPQHDASPFRAQQQLRPHGSPLHCVTWHMDRT